MKNGLLFKELLQTPNFRITVVDDADTVELCGALKVKSPCYFHSRSGVNRVGALLAFWNLIPKNGPYVLGTYLREE